MDKLLLIRNEIEYKKQNLYDKIFIGFVVILLAFFFFLTQFWVSISVVQMNSMCDTLNPNDKLITDKLATPKRGDIIVFKYNENTDYIKRVIAVENQIVYNDRFGDVFLEYVNKNGEKVVEQLNENYVKGSTFKNMSDFYIDDENSLFRVEVKKGELFVMGDNRIVSVDSRDFGCISTKQVKGVVHQFWVDNKDIVGKIFRG